MVETASHCRQCARLGREIEKLRAKVVTLDEVKAMTRSRVKRQRQIIERLRETR